MTPKDLLRDPTVSVVNAWKALGKLLGPGIQHWEPDTIALELERAGIPPAASLMTRLLAAQTAMITGLPALDHEAMFAFALACDGVPHHAGSRAHPTVEQLAYAIDQLRKLRPDFDPEEHTDPDEVDAAIAVVLKMDGWFVAPEQLAFVQPILDNITHGDTKVIAKVHKFWPGVAEAIADETRLANLDKLPEDDVGVIQLKRLAAVARYLHERIIRDTQHARGAGLD